MRNDLLCMVYLMSCHISPYVTVLIIISPGADMITKLLKMQLLEDDDELAYTPSEDKEKKREIDGRPAWMRTLHNSLTTWMQLVPKVTGTSDMSDIRRSKGSIRHTIIDVKMSLLLIYSGVTMSLHMCVEVLLMAGICVETFLCVEVLLLVSIYVLRP